MVKKWFVLISLLLLSAHASNDCPYGEAWNSIGGGRQQKLLQSRATEDLSSECFAHYLVRIAEREKEQGRSGIELMEAIDSYARKRGFQVTLLHALASKSSIIDVLTDVQLRQLWKAHNGSYREYITTLSDKGMYQEADSIYQAMHSFKALDVYDLLRWTKIKGVVGDFHGLGRLVCEVAINDERLTQIAQNHMDGQLADAEPHQRDVALQTYQDCYLATQPPDSTDFGLWLAAQYERYGFLKKQIIVLKRVVANPTQAARQLLMAAHRRLSDGMYPLARDAAKAAYQRLSDQETRREAASLVYRAYTALNFTDSALVWMERTDLRDPDMLTSAVSMYQRALSFGAADSMIAQLSPSVQRDTLVLRQLIFQGRIAAAHDSLESFIKKGRWKAQRAETLLWRLRLAAFQGHSERIPGLIDSTSFAPTNAKAGEILRLKYESLKLASFPQAIKIWSDLLLKIYSGRPESAVDTFEIEGFPPDIQNLLMGKLLNALVEAKRWTPAREAVQRIKIESPDPQIQFLTARIQFQSGDPEGARKTLEQLMLNHPGHVFAGKARIFLRETE